MGCAPGLNCNSCDHCGPLVSFNTRRAPGTCCPEPTCDNHRYDPEKDRNLRCEMCGKCCRICVLGGKEEGDHLRVDGLEATEDEIKLASQYMNRLRAGGTENGLDMIRWARKQLADPEGRRPL
jgi:hypothetical protein